jgi:hypothetical protein
MRRQIDSTVHSGFRLIAVFKRFDISSLLDSTPSLSAEFSSHQISSVPRKPFNQLKSLPSTQSHQKSPQKLISSPRSPCQMIHPKSPDTSRLILLRHPRLSSLYLFRFRFLLEPPLALNHQQRRMAKKKVETKVRREADEMK